MHDADDVDAELYDAMGGEHDGSGCIVEKGGTYSLDEVVFKYLLVRATREIVSAGSRVLVVNRTY